jgi:hypothetical protein
MIFQGPSRDAAELEMRTASFDTNKRDILNTVASDVISMIPGHLLQSSQLFTCLLI